MFKEALSFCVVGGTVLVGFVDWSCASTVFTCARMTEMEASADNLEDLSRSLPVEESRMTMRDIIMSTIKTIPPLLDSGILDNFCNVDTCRLK